MLTGREQVVHAYPGCHFASLKAAQSTAAHTPRSPPTPIQEPQRWPTQPRAALHPAVRDLFRSMAAVALCIVAAHLLAGGAA